MKETDTDDGKATVYVYRLDTGELPSLAPTIFVNGKPMFKLPQLGYGVMRLKPGQYKFETRIEKDTVSIEVASENTISIDSTKDHFIQWLPINKGTDAYFNAVTVVTFISNYSAIFQQVPNHQALEEIKVQRKVKPIINGE